MDRASERAWGRRSWLLTISSRTLLDTATLKGWNLLMAEKADSSTSVCGSLGEAVIAFKNKQLKNQILLSGGGYLVASLVPKEQYLTGTLSLSAFRETRTSGRGRGGSALKPAHQSCTGTVRTAGGHRVIQACCSSSSRPPARPSSLPLHPRPHPLRSPDSVITRRAHALVHNTVL